MVIVWIAAGLLTWLALFIIVTYNRIIRMRNEAERSWSNIDVALKQRNDEVPNLLRTVKGYAKHERGLLERITKLRSSITRRNKPASKAAASDDLTDALASLFALAENYPVLAANKNFLSLQRRISAIEDIIADRREHYNSTTTLYNTRIAQFPSSLIARLFGFSERELFAAHTQHVEVRF